MERITGTLKYFGPTKEGNRATLTGDWSNGEKKLWVSWAETKPLRDARMVYKSSEVWEDGKPKWKVDGKPNIVLEVTVDGQAVKTKVLTNGVEPEAKSPDKASPEDTPETAPTGRSTLDKLAKHFAKCLAAAGEIWSDESGDITAGADVLYKTAFTLYRDTEATTTATEEPPIGEAPETLDEEEESFGDSDTPF